MEEHGSQTSSLKTAIRGRSFIGERMNLYRVKSHKGVDKFIDILNEDPNGFNVKISSTNGSCTREQVEFISRDLFETCLRTGYLNKIEDPVPVLR